MHFDNYIKNVSTKYAHLLHRLKDGNTRFVNNVSKNRDFHAQRISLLQGQAPFATILTCSDSRIVPNFIFDEEIGAFFIIRTIGNTLDDGALAGIEYSVHHLKSKLLLIMGHTQCGGINAAISGKVHRDAIHKTIVMLHPAVITAREKIFATSELLREATIENVRNQMNAVSEKSEELAQLIKEKKFLVVGGIYNLNNGLVEFI